MNPSFPPVAGLNGVGIPRFSGTGADGKPRVVIAKADYTLDNLTAFQASPEIEIAGVATDPDTFARLLETKHPDVVLIGSTFGYGDDAPLNVLTDFIEKLAAKGDTKTPIPGVVVNSVFSTGVVDWISRCRGMLLGQKDRPLPAYEHVGGASNRLAADLVAAVKKVDPFPPSAK